MALNFFVCLGRLAADPELKTTPAGVSVASARVAINRPYSREKEHEADFVSVTAWRHTAEFLCRNFKKGDPVQICGQLRTRTYKDANGKNVCVTGITANSVDFVEGAAKRHDAASSYQSSYSPNRKAEADIGGNWFDTDEDLPF